MPTELILPDADLPKTRPRMSFAEYHNQYTRSVVASVPAEPSLGEQRPVDWVAYPTGWVSPLGHFYRCHFLADEHDRVATAWGPLLVPNANGAWRQALEAEGWVALRSDGTVVPDGPVTATQRLFLTTLVLDGGEDLDPIYRDGLVRTLFRLAGKPLAPDELLPERLPLPPMLTLDEAIQRSPNVAAWIDPDGRLYICERQMHSRFATVLAHYYRVAGSARESWLRLERAGWAHLADHGEVRCTYRLLTQAQLDRLGDLLADERLPADYRERVGRSLEREARELDWSEGGRR